MTTEEKLQHFYQVSIDSARNEAEKTIAEFKETLAAGIEQHKQEKLAASEHQFKIESENAVREINKALSSEHLHIKRRLSSKQQQLKDLLFGEVQELLVQFTKDPSYLDWLEGKVKEALEIAQEEEIQVYLTGSDSGFAEELKQRTGIAPLVSETPFLGGIRAVIPGKNILIDHTFLTAFENEKELFNFDKALTLTEV